MPAGGGQGAVIYTQQLQDPARIYRRGWNRVQGLVMDHYWIILVLTLSQDLWYFLLFLNEKASYGILVNAKLICN